MNLLRALATVSSMTLLSRILGLVRDYLIARVFGVSAATDAFLVAFRLPNLLRRVFGEGAFSQAFVPILAEYKSRRGEADMRRLIDHVAGLLALALFIVTAIGILAAPVIVYISAPGFAAIPEKFQLTVELLRITFPYIFFISLVSLAGGILNIYNRFSVAALTPALLNLSFIGFTWWAARDANRPIEALAWAVFFGGILQLIFQAPHLMRLKLMPRFKLDLKDAGVWRVVRQMGPAMLGVSVSQISLLINTIFASFLVTGSVTWLYYADRLMEFPTALLGVGLGTVLLPSLSRHHADSSTEEYAKLLDWGLRLTVMLALPAAVALAILAIPLTATLFFYGEFSVHDVLMTCNALIAYSVGLLGLIMVKVLAPGFYARQNIKTPVKIGITSLVATQIMNLIFVWPLQHAGLALAISLGACINAGLLFHQLRKQNIYTPQPGWPQFALKIAIAIVMMSLCIWLAAGDPESWLATALITRVWKLAAIIVLGVVVYFGTLVVLGFRPKDFVQRGVH